MYSGAIWLDFLPGGQFVAWNEITISHKCWLRELAGQPPRLSAVRRKLHVWDKKPISLSTVCTVHQILTMHFDSIPRHQCSFWSMFRATRLGFKATVRLKSEQTSSPQMV